MRKFIFLYAALIAHTGFAQAQQGFQITGITIAPMSTANLCASLGGSRKAPAVVIHHSKIAGIKIVVKMFDDTSRGSHINHGTTSVTSNGSGETALTHAFIPPCNTSRASTSNYSVAAEAKGSRKQILFGRYDSAAGKIVK